MAKSSVKVRRRYRDNIDISANHLKRKISLLKHLRDTKFSISNTLLSSLKEDETPNNEEPVSNSTSFFIPEQINRLTTKDESPQLQSKKLTFSNSSASNISDALPKFEPNAFNQGLTSNSTKNINNNEKNIHFNDDQKVTDEVLLDNIDFMIPSITELEESGLQAYYDLFLNSATWQINNLNVKPGDSFFIFWFVVSSYIPLLCSCSGPLSNIFSLLAIICPWKINKNNSAFQKDPYWCYLVNSISIVFAILSNLFLLLNYRKKIRYTYCQIISICGWGIACCILTILIIVYHAWFYRTHLDDEFIIGEGFWFALITIVLHFANFLMLLLNEFGFLMKKYKPVFNIDKVQETLIIQTTSMCIWLIIGASIFSRLLKLSLGDSFLYCVISLVTIGSQGQVPTDNPAAQTLSALWILFGLVMFGLIVSSIRQMMIDFSRSTLFWHRIESLRRSLLKKHLSETSDITTNKESFNLIKNIHKWAFTIQGTLELALSICIFMITLMCGALGFTLLEPWSYKLSCYFCFFNLMTLGQGNQTPISPGGKVFFCAWALAAIPVMTILVSTSSDFVFSRMTNFEEITFFEAIVEYCTNHKYLKNIGHFLNAKKDVILDKKSVSLLRSKSLIQTDTSVNFFDQKSNDKRPIDQAINTSLSCTIDESINLSITDLPVYSHPADMLYTVLLTSEGINNYQFVNSRPFVRSNTAAIHLANYFREGKHVDLDAEQLSTSRKELIHKIKALDKDFDVDEFKRVYNFNEDSTLGGIDNVSVVQKDHSIHTGFKKKNDYVLNKLSRIQIILLELKRALANMCTDTKYSYTYEEWQTLFKLTNKSGVMEDNLYWIESRSPLVFPMQQPNYFALHYLRYLELYVQEFALDWDGIDISVNSTDKTPSEMSR